MKVTKTKISDVLIIEPKVYNDSRGSFCESFNQNKFEQIIGEKINFVQDNHSISKKGVIRGLHYQLKPYAQGKLVRCIEGSVFDVAVDIRKQSPTFGQWVGVILSAENNKQLWIPEGFAHGFIALTDHAQFLYKTTNFYEPLSERCILWNDPQLNVIWPEQVSIIQSSKDEQGNYFKSAEYYE